MSNKDSEKAVSNDSNAFSKHHSAMHLKTDEDWQFLITCEKLRNCLLHANGRIDLSKTKAELERIVQTSNGLIECNVHRITLTDKFIGKMNTVLQRLIDEIEERESS